MSAAKRRTRILLVNGDATVQQLSALMLRMEGHHVDTTASLDFARAALSLLQYHLVVVDVGHFAPAGLEFCEEIKQKYPGQKLLMRADDNVFLGPKQLPG